MLLYKFRSIRKIGNPKCKGKETLDKNDHHVMPNIQAKKPAAPPTTSK